MPVKEKPIFDEAHQWDEIVKGETVRCYQWGEGRPILLVHGWMGRATQFRKLIVQLNNMGYACYAFDGIGHGRSTGKKTSILDFADVVELFYEKYGKFDAVVGHSLGGVAVLYARTKFELTDRVITLASPAIGRAIVEEYGARVNANLDHFPSTNKYIKDAYGRNFEDYTAEFIVRKLGSEVDHTHFHDLEDQQATFHHAEAIVRNRPETKLITTQGLGHNRILKDDDVIKQVIALITSD